MTDWKEITLSDIGKVVTGKTPPTSDVSFYGGAYPFITPTDMKDDYNYCTTDRYLSDGGKNLQKSILLPKNAVCYTCIASIGKMCLTQKESFTNQQINSVIVDENKAYYKFIFYLLKYLTPQIKKMAGGTITGIINKGQFEKFPFEIPDSIEEQKEIAGVLSSLDDKIELLREENKTLEATAQTIFKEWFVNFNFPNAEGNPYKSSGGKMIDSELGETPEGWRVGAVKDLINIFSGFAFSSVDFIEGGKYKLVTIKNVQDRHFVQDIKDSFDELPSKMPLYCHLKTGEILLSLTGNVGRICLVVGENYLLNQRVAKLKAVNAKDYAFTYFLFLQESTFSLLQSTASGTAQQNLSPVQTKEIKIIVPLRNALDVFGDVANPMIEKINQNNSEIQTLSTLRDTFLPKLMSGEIRL